MKTIILDIREKSEFERERIEDSIHLPLSELREKARDTLTNLAADEVIVMCRSGMRANMALNQLQEFDDLKHKYTVYQGGLIRWKAQGKPTIKKPLSESFPINRQVHLVAFAILISGLLLSDKHDFFKVLPFLVSFGLALDAFTGFCPMRKFLQFAPWNRTNN
jgi:rhodanese-related sulfurtransferase